MSAFKSPIFPAQPWTQAPFSPFTSTQVQDLLDSGLFAPERHPVLIMTAFPVPKDESRARIVQDARRINDYMRLPPRSDLPGRADIEHFVRQAEYGFEADGRQFFFQFPLHPEISRWFCIRLRSKRTWRLKRMCMGWSYSMAIAQRASSMIVQATIQGRQRAAGLAYADNFIIGADTLSHTQSLVPRLQHVATGVGCTLKDPTEVSHVMNVLGLRLNLRDKSVQISTESRDKIIRRTARVAQPGHTYLRVWKLLGTLFWASHHLRHPLCEYPNLMKWIRRRSRFLVSDTRHFTRKAHWYPTAHTELITLAEAILDSPPVPVPPDPNTLAERTFELWTDASLSGGGVIACGPRRTTNRAWAWTQRQKRTLNIHLMEARALRRGVHIMLAMLEPGDHILAKVDNTPVVFATTKQLSKDPRLNVIIADVLRALKVAKVHMTVQYVTSAEQKADELSRAYAKPKYKRRHM
eukprot:gene10393-3197_t